MKIDLIKDEDGWFFLQEHETYTDGNYYDRDFWPKEIMDGILDYFEKRLRKDVRKDNNPIIKIIIEDDINDL